MVPRWRIHEALLPTSRRHRYVLKHRSNFTRTWRNTLEFRLEIWYFDATKSESCRIRRGKNKHTTVFRMYIISSVSAFAWRNTPIINPSYSKIRFIYLPKASHCTRCFAKVSRFWWVTLLCNTLQSQRVLSVLQSEHKAGSNWLRHLMR